MTSTTSNSNSSAPQTPWYHPIVSPEHGVYVVLFVSFLTGAAAAQHWTITTTIALICAFLGFQAEHPLTLQVKQRRRIKPRFLVWGGLYVGTAAILAIYLYFSIGRSGEIPLLGIYAGAIVALGIDFIAVFHRDRKSILNEFITFAAVCLAAPFAYVATTGTISTVAIALWGLNTLFFSSAIFTVKLRKPKTQSVVPGAVYHVLAALLVIGMGAIGWLNGVMIFAFSLSLLKFGLILWRQDWYRTAPIQSVAQLETVTALGFAVLTCLSLLPTHLSP
jgi:hypothetical protein